MQIKRNIDVQDQTLFKCTANGWNLSQVNSKWCQETSRTRDGVPWKWFSII